MLAGDDKWGVKQKSRRLLSGGSLQSLAKDLSRLLRVPHHGFHFEELLEAELAPFAAGAGLLVACLLYTSDAADE